MTKKILVYADWVDLPDTMLIGVLTSDIVRGKEVFAFEYTEEWIKSSQSQYLDPDLQLFSGRQFLRDEKPNFGMFLDSSPDRWGRLLMKRKEAIVARKEGRKAETLFESDFLLGVFDGSRMGGLRFKIEEDGHFLSFEEGLAAPPWINLRDLEFASLQLEKDDADNDEEDLKWLNMLISPGSSLGGARPKASVRDQDDNLWIAKFPSSNDEVDIGAWEMVVHELATTSGVTVAPAMLQKYTGSHHTFLTKRFDRVNQTQRIHFASAMTLLGYRDGADHHEGVSYLDLAGIIQQRGRNINENLKELWRRIVFNIMVKNTDDHLRNHGFLLYQDGWELSPAYDMNAVSAGAGLTLNISENDNSLSG
ncbi:MAG: HipA domain-containing protein, partial [Daejeonella sp.]|uniref:type II toxin-antitoxin system HipA family toxin n=1 Tax=Daejeonella sp. TaxID=2805397 RepID=UPI003C76F849